jgi:predicted transcriptional regulator
VDTWFADVGISLLSEWDVLLFLHRRKTSLTSAAQIAHLVGYGKSLVGEALDSLVHLGIVRRSRSSQGIRLYDFSPQESYVHQESLNKLLTISDSRSGRLLIIRNLQDRRPRINALERAGLHLAKIEQKQKEA